MFSRPTLPGERIVFLLFQKTEQATRANNRRYVRISSLNWKVHTAVAVVKLRRANGVLSQAQALCFTSHSIKHLPCIFTSHLRYACQLWGLLCDNTTTQNLHLAKYCFAKNISHSSVLRAQPSLRNFTISEGTNPTKLPQNVVSTFI